MADKELESQTLPEKLYAAKLAEFAARKEAILHPPPPTAPQATTFWERIGISKPGPTAPISSPTGEQLTALEQEFYSWLYADRQMVVCHLKANPTTQEEVIKRYCQSPELLNDPKTLGCFFEFWLQEFFQKTDTGKVENLFPFISSARIKRLPRELQQAKKNIFDPLSKRLDAEVLDRIKVNLRSFGFNYAACDLAQTIISRKLPLPNPLTEEYRKYVHQLVKMEVGIVPTYKNEPEPAKVKASPLTKKPAEVKSSPSDEKQTGVLPVKNAEYHFLIVAGKNSEPEKVSSLQELAKAMKGIKRLGKVTPEIVWERLQNLAKMDYRQRMERYGEMVAGGSFKNWNKIGIGDKWWVIFEVEGDNIYFRVGHHDDVYATKRRKGPDRTRKL